MMRTLRSACCGLLLLGAAATAHAQDATLDRVQNLAATGRFTEARSTLDQWERSFADPRSNATASDRARALYLRGVLSTDAKEAEDAFLGVVLSYPSSSSAPPALLRLGQGYMTAGEPARAIPHLERLRTDYPGSQHRETGLLWLARAQLAAGAAPAACASAREGLTIASSPNVVTLLELERDNACTGNVAAAPATAPARAFPSTAVAADPEPGAPVREERAPPPAAARPARDESPPAPPAAQPEPPRTRADTPPPAAAAPAPTPAAPTPATRPAPASTATQFAVQVAAFRERAAAERTVREMRAKGLNARIVQVDGSPLFRVRYGAFATRDQANTAMRRVRDAGFDAFIVTDVNDER